jgi:2-polyprenyl-3-methyl-5-hydroxy-6-metoxy-1,4-benzoquinol methylase
MTGLEIQALTNLGADTWGIEYSAKKIGEAVRLGGLPEGRVAVGDIEAIEFADDHFDVALINEVLEHVPHDDAGIREVHRILKSGSRSQLRIGLRPKLTRRRPIPCWDRAPG